MGSATLNNITNMADDKKKSIKGLIKNIFGKKKDKCKEKDLETNKNIEKHTLTIETQPQINPVDALLQNFKKLELEKKKEEEDDELKNFSFQKVDEDERDNFTFKVIEEERRTERTESHSSQDSGFSERDDVSKEDDDVIKGDEQQEALEDDLKPELDLSVKINAEKDGIKPESDITVIDTSTVESVKTGASNEENVELLVKDGEELAKTDEGLAKADEELLEGLENLKIDDGKKKKPQLVPVARTPIRKRVSDFVPNVHPYGLDSAGDYRQINQVNKHTWSGGHVTVTCRDSPKSDTSRELQTFSEDLAQRGVQFGGPPYELDLIQEYINEDTDIADISFLFSPAPEADILQDFIQDPSNQQQIATITAALVQQEPTNPIEELENSNHLNYEQISNLDTLIGFEEDKLYKNMYPTPPSAEAAHSPKNDQFYSNFLTPPRSDVASSPLSDSTSIYPTNSDYTLSPSSDCEKYQEIPQCFEEFADQDVAESKERERNVSTSSLSMKNFKDLQRELSGSFSKNECCQISRKPCKEIFQEHLNKLKPEERKGLCVKVSGLDLKSCYGVLHQILLSLSRGTQELDLHLALFALVCERVLAERPQLFVEDFGLSVLQAAALRCPARPLLTRYVVQCVRAAARQDNTATQGKQYLFREVDAQGDTLVTACARAGEQYAAVLAELLRAERPLPPLFNVHHSNTEGYSALQVACREHAAGSPRLHTVHVLLEHGGADIWKGDVKGNDTAVHMAVNSPTCDLSLVLLLFRHLDRKQWKKLAHVPNRSSVTPLDYARCAVKSTTRQNYPTEVLDFLKKCR